MNEPALSATISSVFSDLATPMAARPTDVAPSLRPLPDVRAVLFDVYGTLVMSAATGGEADPAAARTRAAAMERAVATAGIVTPLSPDALLARYDECRAAALDTRRRAGCEHPEADIREVWGTLLESAGAHSTEAARLHAAALFEALTNPTWPMPGARAVLATLRARSFRIGLVSNAQFYTLPMLAALLGSSPTDLGLDPELIVLSADHGRGKPDPWLYREAARRLAARDITPGQALHVGNDMLKDVWAARQAGLRAALFAGDGRSLDLRSEDPRVSGLAPDLVLTELTALPACLPETAR